MNILQQYSQLLHNSARQLHHAVLNNAKCTSSQANLVLSWFNSGVQQVNQQHDLVVGSTRSIVTGYTNIPKVKHDRYRTPPQNYVQLLQHITRSRDVPTLSKLVQKYGTKFDAVHVAAAMAMMPKLHQPPNPGRHLNEHQLKRRKKSAMQLMSQLQATATTLVPRMFAGHVSSITYSLARSRRLLPGSTTTTSTTQHLLHAMLKHVAQDQARLLWQGANGTSISQLLYAMARLGYSTGSRNSDTQVSAAPAATKVAHQLCKIIARYPSRLQMRDLATSAWALGRISTKLSKLPESSVQAAWKAISNEAISRKLWLRPTSMSGLLTAAVWLHHKDQALLAAICEEAGHQLRSMGPPHLATFAWALSQLEYTPDQQLLSGLTAEAQRKLQDFNASNLGLFLAGMTQLQALDKQLLSDIAAGIAEETEVRVLPRDAVSILSAFGAVPDAGKLQHVESMAGLFADCILSRRQELTPAMEIDLLECYSKLPYKHSLVANMLVKACSHPEHYTLRQWISLLRSAAQLGYPQHLARAYQAADLHLQDCMRQKGTTAFIAAPIQDPKAMQQRADTTWWSYVSDSTQELFTKGHETAAQPPAAPQPAALQRKPSVQPSTSREVSQIAELAHLLGKHRHLSADTAAHLADAGCQWLPHLKPRQLLYLLAAVTSRNALLEHGNVLKFVVQAAEHIKGLDLSSTSTITTTTLVRLLKALSMATARGLDVNARQLAQQAIQSIQKGLLPVLEECSMEQLQDVWQTIVQSRVGGDVLRKRVQELSAQNKWSLGSKSLVV